MGDLFENWWFKAITYALFAAFGGIMGYLMRAFDAGARIRWGKLVVEGAGAGFVGVLIFFICQATHLSAEWTGVIVGVTGWLGAKATIKMLEKVVFTRLGVTSPKESENADETR